MNILNNMYVCLAAPRPPPPFYTYPPSGNKGHHYKSATLSSQAVCYLLTIHSEGTHADADAEADHNSRRGYFEEGDETSAVSRLVGIVAVIRQSGKHTRPLDSSNASNKLNNSDTTTTDSIKNGNGGNSDPTQDQQNIEVGAWSASASVSASTSMPGPAIPRRAHRTVVLPQWQGMGIGSRLSDAVAEVNGGETMQVMLVDHRRPKISHFSRINQTTKHANSMAIATPLPPLPNTSST